jgi:acyl carrier protein
VNADRGEIEQAIRDFVLREFLPGEGPEALDAAPGLMTGGILDSLSILALVDFLEERWGVTLEAHELDVEHLDTIGDIAELVQRKRKG